MIRGVQPLLAETEKSAFNWAKVLLLLQTSNMIAGKKNLIRLFEKSNAQLLYFELKKSR